MADAGQDGWGAAATASSAVLGGLFLMLIALGAGLAYSIAGSGNNAFTSGMPALYQLHFTWQGLDILPLNRGGRDAGEYSADVFMHHHRLSSASPVVHWRRFEK